MQRGKIALVSDKLNILERFPGRCRSYSGHALCEFEEFMTQCKKKSSEKSAWFFLLFENWLSVFGKLKKPKTS